MNYCQDLPHPAVAVDSVVFGFDGVHLNVLLVQRTSEPHMDRWAFPGGLLNIDEDAPDGAIRALNDKTGLQVEHIEQLGAFTAPHRDPRERVISIAFFALVRMCETTGDAQWFRIDRLPELAFDHRTIFEKALLRLSHFIKLGTGDFVCADFSYEEMDAIYYATLTR